MNNNIIVREATNADAHFAETITNEMAESAKARGTGIAKRSPEYLKMKMEEGKAVIATTPEGLWVGFCYIESWEHEKFVANSGLVVAPAFRKGGVATLIKRKVFELSKKKYPNAKIFGPYQPVPSAFDASSVPEIYKFYSLSEEKEIIAKLTEMSKYKYRNGDEKADENDDSVYTIHPTKK